MINNLKNWLVVGIPQNWETALSQPLPLWGLKPRYQAEFQTLSAGDFVWLYVTSPVAGIVGVGIVKDKYIDNINLIWPEELKKKQVIWPLRFRIHVLKVLPRELWKANKIKITDFNLFWQLGFQALTKEHTAELLKRMGIDFGLSKPEDLSRGATLMQPMMLREKQAQYIVPQILTDKLTLSHGEIQESVAEIGKLQFYYTELEYPLELSGEKKKLDVVWKREVDSVPTFAFEIELSGMLEKALERLKLAYRKWNSRPRLVIPKEFVVKAHNIIGSTDKDFRNEIKIYEPSQIVELLNQKRNLKSLEQNLNLY